MIRRLFFLVLTTMWAGAVFLSAEEGDAELRQYLSLLTAAHLGDDYNAIKKLVPDIGALQPDAGDHNTEALIKIKVGAVLLKGEFNFAQGHLVSHGFETGQLTHAEAHDFLLRCVAILEKLYGPAERRIELPSETDGPSDSIGLHFAWHKGKTSFALDFRYRRESATFSWGAQ